MDSSTNDALLLDMIESVALDVLARIGHDPDARFEFFRRFVALAQEVVRRAETAGDATQH